MNISILTEYYFNLAQKRKLESLGSVLYCLNPVGEAEIIHALRDADIAVVNLSITALTKKIVSSCRKLRYVSLSSTGYNLLDVDLLKKSNIVVSNNPNYSTDAVAEHTFALLFAILHRIPSLNQRMKVRPFQMKEPSKYIHLASVNVKGKTLGIIGFGNIGQRVSQIGRGLGMKILVYNRSRINSSSAKQVSFNMLLSSSDIISLHLPLTAETEHLIGEAELKIMRPTSILLCTSRGKHIDNRALAKAIRAKQIFGAGLDVLEDYSKKNPLLRIKDNVVLTPHSAWLSQESLHCWAEGIIGNIESYIKGVPRNIVC